MLDKPRIHYGGISCNACRHFFRRVTNEGEEKRCKWNGMRPVDQYEPRMCQACRYEKCLGTGMRKDLVLSLEKRKNRFRALTFRKEMSKPDEEAIKKKTHKNKHDPLWDDTGQSSSSDDDDFEFSATSFHEDIDYLNHGSTLDPVTGWLNPDAKEFWELNQDEQMLNYVHKKFRNIRIPEYEFEECKLPGTIKDIIVSHEPHNGTTVSLVLQNNSTESKKLEIERYYRIKYEIYLSFSFY
jgi:hypothetical protein